ncbi:MAG: SIMPL domain-containing protein [Tepidamorphaceae bacterium]
MKLGRIVSMTEDANARPPVPMMRMARAEAAMDASVPIAAGEQSLRVNVSITWEIEQ